MRLLVTIILFVGVYVLTFKPAWRLLRTLVTDSVTRRRSWRDPGFWGTFILFRLVIAAPYAVYFLLGRNMPTTLTRVVIGWLALGVVLRLLSLVGPERTIRFMWWLYGYVYDGLLHFYPYRNLVEKVVHRLDLQPGMRLLDLGCGTGNVIMAARLAADVTVVGVDGSSSMLRRAKRKLQAGIDSGKVQLYRRDLVEFLRSQPSASFDRISLVNVLYAVSDREAVWQECRRLLRNDGAIVATTSDRDGIRPIVREHLANARLWELVSPRLVVVWVVNFFIEGFAKAGAFAYPSEDVLLGEVAASGGVSRDVERVYGGPEQGVNLLWSVT